MSDTPLHRLLKERLARIEERLAAACRRSGRDRKEITLVAVTKTVPSTVADALVELGVVNLGENRPQELWKKAAEVRGPVRWHLLGHLQRNKVEQTLPLVRLIHSVDSLRLLAALETEAERTEQPIDVLLEVNASREEAKHGFEPNEMSGLVPQLLRLRHVRLRGLMTMAALETDPERCRPTFAALRRLRDDLGMQLGASHSLKHLSMGMSSDFEVAVEEGSTFVRIGTALFEGMSG